MSFAFNPPLNNDIVIVARTLWAEARGESTLGREAVAAVIGNRATIAAAYFKNHGYSHRQYGDGTLGAVCTQHWETTWQFTCWSPDDCNHEGMLAVTASNPTFNECLSIARDLAHGQLVDPTKGAVNYLDIPATLRLYGHLPGWVNAMVRTTTIGNHTFYK